MARLTSTTVPDASLRPLATLRPRGTGRFFVGAFLALWLCGWAGGEVAVLGVIGSAAAAALGLLPEEHLTRFSFDGNLPLGAVFMGTWLALWTVGGVGALAMLGRLLFGVDEVLCGVGGLVVRTGVGPFRRERRVPREQLFGVHLTSNGSAVVATLVGEHWQLTTLGTRDERAALVEAITDAVGVTTTSLDVARVREPPAPMTASERDGALYLVRAARAWPLVGVMVAVALFCALSIVRAMRLDVLDTRLPTVVVGCAAIALGLVGARRREVGFVVRGSTLLQRDGLLTVRERVLSGELEVKRHVDSEGDERFELRCGSRVLHRSTDAAPCLHLGHFLAARTNQPLRETM